MEYVTLNNGVKMPKVGLGTFLIPRENVIDTIGMAYDLGYRSFDTAWRYHNEDLISQALKIHHIPREEVFITTKVNIDALYWGGYQWTGWRKNFNIRKRSVRQAIEESFKNLNMDYIDLFLIHYPVTFAWHMYRDLTELYHEGRIRAIGVSNFLPPHIDALNMVSDVVPAINQFELSPLNGQKRLVQYCLNNGIVPLAMSTFSHYRSNEPRMEIINSPILIPIAEKYRKSTVQIVLRWMIQQGITVIPKTWVYEHLKQNIELFDFELSPEEMLVIDSMDQGKFLNYDPHDALVFLPRYYPGWDKFLSY